MSLSDLAGTPIREPGGNEVVTPLSAEELTTLAEGGGTGGAGGGGTGSPSPSLQQRLRNWFSSEVQEGIDPGQVGAGV